MNQFHVLYRDGNQVRGSISAHGPKCQHYDLINEKERKLGNFLTFNTRQNTKAISFHLPDVPKGNLALARPIAPLRTNVYASYKSRSNDKTVMFLNNKSIQYHTSAMR